VHAVSSVQSRVSSICSRVSSIQTREFAIQVRRRVVTGCNERSFHFKFCYERTFHYSRGVRVKASEAAKATENCFACVSHGHLSRPSGYASRLSGYASRLSGYASRLSGYAGWRGGCVGVPRVALCMLAARLAPGAGLPVRFKEAASPLRRESAPLRHLPSLVASADSPRLVSSAPANADGHQLPRESSHPHVVRGPDLQQFGYCSTTLDNRLSHGKKNHARIE
jgi:hypothetical protein